MKHLLYLIIGIIFTGIAILVLGFSIQHPAIVGLIAIIMVVYFFGKIIVEEFFNF